MIGKNATYGFLNSIGMNAVFRLLNRENIRIFTLHGVSDYSAQCSWVPLRRQLDVNDLRTLLCSLTEHYKFISIEDAVAIIRNEIPARRNAAVLTFDDGYRNNFTRALPVLEEFGVPGVFYLATGLVESREPFWVDRLDFLLQSAATNGTRFQVAGKEFAIHSSERSEVSAVYDELRRHCKNHYMNDREFTEALAKLADTLEHDLGVSAKSVLNSDEWAAVISPGEIPRYANNTLVTLGGHTVSHLRLSYSSRDEITRELLDSKKSIELWSDKKCLHFAYPNGSFNEESAALVAEAGYASAVTTRYGMARVGDDPFALRRMSLPSNFRRSEMLARASGLEAAIMSAKSMLMQVKKAVFRR